MPELPPMSTYQFGLLRKGAKWTPGRNPATDSLQGGHMKNIQRMYEMGLLVAAGPFLDGGDLRGIYVFRADSVERIRAASRMDPAIQAGRLAIDLTAWLAPSGIGRLYRERSAGPGFRDSMITYRLGLLKKGPKWTDEMSEGTQALQIEHVNSILDRIRSGDYATAGPLLEDGPYLGVVVIRGDSAHAASLAGTDPAVRAGRLVAELHPWMTAWGTFPGDTL